MRYSTKIMTGLLVLITSPTIILAKPFIPTQQQVISSVRQEFDKKLIDYSSARFRDTYMFKTKNDFGDPEYYLCGWVNSKNHFGGYTGWKQFKGDYVSITTVDDNDILKPIVTAYCDETRFDKANNTDYTPQLSPNYKPPPKTKK